MRVSCRLSRSTQVPHKCPRNDLHATLFEHMLEKQRLRGASASGHVARAANRALKLLFRAATPQSAPSASEKGRV